MDKLQKLFIILLIVGIPLILALKFSLPFAITSTPEVKYLVPVQASVKCEIIGKDTLEYTIPSQGYWISKNTLGINTKTVENIQSSVIDSVGIDYRVIYKRCNQDQTACGSDIILNFPEGYGKMSTVSLPSIDVTKESLYIKVQSTINFWITKTDVSGAIIRFTAEKFGLRLYSTTMGQKIICSTGCDLNCPSQSDREKLVYNPKDTLNFYEATNYIEYWNEPSLKSEQLGGTIWISSQNLFCFGGYLYKAGYLEMEDGTKYTYPAIYDRKVDCCPNARISITNGYKECTSSFLWKTITTEQPQCISVIQCPGSGQPTCTQEGGIYYKSGYSCVSGKCVQQLKIPVACCPPDLGCPSDQTCQNYQCVGGGIVSPPIVYNGSLPPPLITCSSCDSFALSYLLGSIWKEKECKPTLFQGPNLCIFSLLKLILVPIIFIFGFFLNFKFILKQRLFQKRETNKLASLLLSLILALCFSYLLFASFVLGSIMGVIYFIFIKFMIGG